MSPIVPIAILGVAAAAAAAAMGKSRRRRKPPEDEVIIFEDEDPITGGPIPGPPAPPPASPGFGELDAGLPLVPPFPGGPSNQVIEASGLWLDWFDSALVSHGVQDFTARELLSAEEGGGYYLRPPDLLAPNLVKVAILAQKLRNRWGGPLNVSSAFRPWDGPKSAHYVATAIDFDLPGGMKTKANEHELRLITARLWKQEPQFAGMGFYRQPVGRVHIDVKSPVKGKKKRYWGKEHVRPILAELSGVAGARTLHQFAYAPQGGQWLVCDATSSGWSGDYNPAHGGNPRCRGWGRRRADIEAIRLSLRPGREP